MSGEQPTKLQREIADLIALLRDGIGSRADFIAATDRVMAHAGALEFHRDYLRHDLIAMQADLALASPAWKLRLDAGIDGPYNDVRDYRLDIRTDLPVWRIAINDRERWLLRNGQSKAGKAMRWQTYLAYCRAVRERLDEAFKRISEGAT